MSILPNGFKDHLKLLKNKYRFPGCHIETQYIGDNVVLGKNCSIAREVVIGNGVEIGNYSYINRGSIVYSAKIGNYCSVAYFSQIGIPEHPVNLMSTSPFVYKDSNMMSGTTRRDGNKHPIIEHDVWIGSGAVILRGTHIGIGAVVAAGAVVAKDVPPYAIVGGVPAKVIRMRFSDRQISYLLDTKWWLRPVEDLAKLRQTIEERLQNLR